jgi:hypothetical protein
MRRVTRGAVVRGLNINATTVAAYLPSNYRVVASDDESVTIEGEDVAGWTLNDYVLPRLASGLMFGTEVET